ncbi:glycosyltransferase [Paracoccus sp. S-4012]|uniref:glycosyltransferase family 2 protein n=1 Tax=Paracoccus sp. S-4012 TaxID=2665648 RepID=UPI0012B0AD4E|nr:glycosyltransferase family 2 protein [Paracoccus sp. S-4012]MRX49910.1 glycosyltransferase [Paracoccus sp. S-4012]
MRAEAIGPRMPGVLPLPRAVPDLSFVIPALNEEDNIAETIRRVAAEARRLVASFEIVVVDDGSSDATFAAAKAQAATFPVRTLRLSRNFGKEHAIMAGLERTIGAAVVILDADLQEPLGHLEAMLAHRAEGFEMVYAVRAGREDESLPKRAFTRLFYAMLNLGSDTAIPADARDFRLMDRRVVDALCALPERNRFMKGLYGWVGFRSKAVPIRLEPRRAGASKFGFRKLFRLGLTGLTSFTAWPLRVWTSIGMAIAVCSILYGLWIVLRTLLFGSDVPGWSTLVVAVSLLGGVQLISIGVLGEYLARVFTEVKGRPGFIVAEDHPADAQQP